MKPVVFPAKSTSLTPAFTSRDGQHDGDGFRTAGRLSQWLRDAFIMRQDR